VSWFLRDHKDVKNKKNPRTAPALRPKKIKQYKAKGKVGIPHTTGVGPCAAKGAPNIDKRIRKWKGFKDFRPTKVKGG